MKRLVFLLITLPIVANAGLKEWGAKKGLELITNLDDVLLDLEADACDLSGLSEDKRIGLSFNLLPFLFPPIYPNMNIKIRLAKEDRKRPQIVGSINYGEIIMMRFLEKMEDVKKAKCYIMGISITCSKGVKERVSMFSGIKFINGECTVELEEKKTTDWISTQDLPTNQKIGEIALFSGLVIKRTEKANWVITSGYIPGKKKMFSKIDLEFRRYWKISFGIYPEGVFFFHPTLGVRF